MCRAIPPITRNNLVVTHLVDTQSSATAPPHPGDYLRRLPMLISPASCPTSKRWRSRMPKAFRGHAFLAHEHCSVVDCGRQDPAFRRVQTPTHLVVLVPQALAGRFLARPHIHRPASLLHQPVVGHRAAVPAAGCFATPGCSGSYGLQNRLGLPCNGIGSAGESIEATRGSLQGRFLDQGLSRRLISTADTCLWLSSDHSATLCASSCLLGRSVCISHFQAANSHPGRLLHAYRVHAGSQSSWP